MKFVVTQLLLYRKGQNNMRLFVDDERQAPKGWHRARTVTEAIRILATMSVEEVSLDYDMSCFSMAGGCTHTSEETFMAVVYYLRIMENRPRIKIHTGNIRAGYQMANLLSIPYTGLPYDERDYDEEDDNART